MTQKTQKAGKIENVAGFFVQALRANYTDNKQPIKQTETAQKTKLAETKRVEEAQKTKVKEQKQALYEKEMQIFDQWIQKDATLIQKLMDIINAGMFRSYYKPEKSFEENMAHPLLKAAFLNAAKEAEPQSFGIA